jgi:hypothetical protein
VKRKRAREQSTTHKASSNRIHNKLKTLRDDGNNSTTFYFLLLEVFFIFLHFYVRALYKNFPFISLVYETVAIVLLGDCKKRDTREKEGERKNMDRGILKQEVDTEKF